MTRRRRGFLLIETLAALVAAAVFLTAAVSIFSSCAGLLSRSRSAVVAETAKAEAIAELLSGETPEGVLSSETVYAEGVGLRRVTLTGTDGKGGNVIVVPQTNLR